MQKFSVVVLARNANLGRHQCINGMFREVAESNKEVDVDTEESQGPMSLLV